MVAGATASWEEDRRWMALALSLAKRGLGRVWPNPAVGCVIVKNGRLLARGWTQPGGRPHAEAMALAEAGGAARGATAYVSLEPCAHFGKTPPCAAALAKAGILRVVAPLEDPDQRVSGKGFALLREAGVHVETGLMAAEAEEVNEGFLMRQRAGRPFLRLKLAATLDGRIATASGESRWITGPAARARVHLMRASHDALLIGAGTARADDPSLDVRLAGLEGRSPLPVIADGRLSLPPSLRIAKPETIRLHAMGEAAKADWGEALSAAPDESGHPAPAAMLQALGAKGLTRVLSEGGGALAAAFLRAGLVDELVWMSAGAVIGADGAPAAAPMLLERLAGAPRFTLRSHEQCGADLISIWRPVRSRA